MTRKPNNAKKKAQLGMDPGTAAGRLLRDLLWEFVRQTGQQCFRCGHPLDRETLSIDHKTAWLHSADPRGLFFAIDNIAYSHLACNSGDGRRPQARTDEDLAALPAAERERILYMRRYARERYRRNRSKT